MSTKVKNQKPLIIAAIVFVVLVVAGVVIWQVTAPKGTAGAKAYENWFQAVVEQTSQPSNTK